MNLRDLWDNVVLRDILGYIVPGLVTLFAIALVVGATAGTTLPEWITKAATKAGLGFLDDEGWRSWRPFVAASLVLPLAYAIGHLQMWIADYPEKRLRSWYTGSIALEHLKDNRLRLEYYSTAVKILPAVRSQDLRQSLANRSDDCIQCRNGDAAQDMRQTALEGADDCGRCRTADAAKHLFLLCDRYVLHKDRDLHSMFMGRYYVLAVLFANLGVSSMVLALAFLLAALPRLQVNACQFLMACVLPVGVPAAFGLALLRRSSYFRRRFVECTFPIFYAIVQAEERSIAGQA